MFLKVSKCVHKHLEGYKITQRNSRDINEMKSARSVWFASTGGDKL